MKTTYLFSLIPLSTVLCLLNSPKALAEDLVRVKIPLTNTAIVITNPNNYPVKKYVTEVRTLNNRINQTIPSPFPKKGCGITNFTDRCQFNHIKLKRR